jgi:hypothetical protein
MTETINQMDRQLYGLMLQDFGVSLEETSLDDAHGVPMTKNQSVVVDFDKFREQNWFMFRSCDAFCIAGTNEDWFLIEFKNGKFKKSDVRLKFFDSLSLLMTFFGKDVCFMQRNMHVVLVYNENLHPRQGIAHAMSHLTKIPTLVFLPDYFEKLYCQSASECTVKEFENQFLKKFGL